MKRLIVILMLLMLALPVMAQDGEGTLSVGLSSCAKAGRMLMNRTKSIASIHRFIVIVSCDSSNDIDINSIINPDFCIDHLY